jgi:hypothetical protein
VKRIDQVVLVVRSHLLKRFKQNVSALAWQIIGEEFEADIVNAQGEEWVMIREFFALLTETAFSFAALQVKLNIVVVIRYDWSLPTLRLEWLQGSRLQPLLPLFFSFPDIIFDEFVKNFHLLFWTSVF